MPLSNASRLADFGTGIGTAGAIIQVDNANQRLGVGTTAPTATLGVAGIVSATAFYGDGSNLDGVASAGLGTALSEEEFNPLTVIYQTSDTLSVGATITVDPPDATTKVAYTQYSDIKLEGDADLIIADGDDFIPDILGLSTEGISFSTANGNGIFDTVYTDNIERADGRGAPNFPKGITVTGISTLSGNVSIGGTLTYEDVTNVDSIGVITARSGIDINAGGLDITAGGLDITAGGINVTAGVSTFAGAITVGSGGINVTGDSTFAGAINANGLLSLAGGADGTLQELRLAQGNASQKLATIKGHSANTNEKGIQFNTFHYTPKIPIKLASTGAIGLGGDNYGTAGQVLTTQGSGDVAQWASVSATPVRDAFNGGSSNSNWGSSDVWAKDHSSVPSRMSGFPTVAGQQMSIDSGTGEWTFPATGVWRATWQVSIYSGANSWYKMSFNQYDGSNWNQLAGEMYGWCGNYTSDQDTETYSFTFNITNSSTHRAKIFFESNGNLQFRAPTWILWEKLT